MAEGTGGWAYSWRGRAKDIEEKLERAKGPINHREAREGLREWTDSYLPRLFEQLKSEAQGDRDPEEVAEIISEGTELLRVKHLAPDM